MPLQLLSPGIHLFASAVNSVVIENGAGGALLIDTGLDDSHAKKVLRALEEMALTPTAILNTHSHADHHGGNLTILRKFPGLPVYAPPLEAAIINHPLLEPLYLFGACPPPELRGKFLLAPSSPAQPLNAGIHHLGGVEVQLLEVPGHAVQMFAVRLGEVLYAADALFGPDALAKHPLTFCADSAAQKASAAALGRLDGVRLTIPGHGEPTAELSGLVQANLSSYQRTTAAVLEAVQQGVATTDDLLARVCTGLGITMTGAGAVVLNRAVVAAHLTELQAAGQVQLSITDNRLCWATS